MKSSHSNRKKSSKSSPRKSHSNRKNYKKSSMNSLHGLPGDLQQRILEDVPASHIKKFSKSHKNQDIIIKNNETLLQEKYENNNRLIDTLIYDIYNANINTTKFF